MATPRRAAGPRLIDWTGERLVPWTDEAQTVYEHFHRYLWAAPLVAGRRVLDLGSGEGYGTALLAEQAAAVVGIDIDPAAVEHSQGRYAHPGLEYRVGSMLALEELGRDEFDVVVAFEVIEHVADHARVLDGIAHVLAPGGLLVISTPDRREYSEATGYDNPFHEHELTEDEMRDMLEAHFTHVRLWGQRAISGSWITAREDTGAPSPTNHFLGRDGDEWTPAPAPAPMYFIALASNGAIPEASTPSLLGDASMEVAARWQRKAEHEERSGRREFERAEHLAHDLMVMTADRDRLQRELDALLEKYNGTSAELAAVQHDLRELRGVLDQSVLWGWFQRARRIGYAVLGGRESRRVHALQATLRLIGRRSSRGR